jgi:hypothetical protein
MSIQTQAQLNKSLVRSQIIDEDIDYDILEKYPLYKDYLFKKTQFPNILTAILYLRQQMGITNDSSEPYYEKMRNFDKNIFEETEYLTDINELLKITKNLGILSILSIESKEFDPITKSVIIQKIANY